MKILTGEDWEFIFIAQEKTFPYAVAVYQTASQQFELGKKANDKARKLYAKCLEKNSWPAYPDKIFKLQFPGWAYKK
jgi:exodeoxyribonuclease VIII